MSTRNCGGMPWALARSSVFTSTPPSTVASWTMARTAYSALADIRMLARLVGIAQRAHRRGRRRAWQVVGGGQRRPVADRHRHHPRPDARGDVLLRVLRPARADFQRPVRLTDRQPQGLRCRELLA